MANLATRSDIADAIFRLPPRNGVFAVDTLSLATITEAGKTPTIEQQEKISRYKNSIFGELLARQQKLTNRGGIRTFEIVDHRRLLLKWCDTTATERKRRKWLRMRACVARWLDGLSDREYEFACGLGMVALGATKIHITPPRDEHGIDFLAIVPAYARNPYLMSRGLGVRIVGQSKKYESSAARNELYAFDRTMGGVRDNKAEYISIIPAWFRGSAAPLLPCFVSHSGFQSGASEFGGQAGHVLVDTLELAEIIARMNGLDQSKTDKTIQTDLYSRLKGIQTNFS